MTRAEQQAASPHALQKYQGGKTKVMASGLRTKAEALALAGCDFLVVVSCSCWWWPAAFSIGKRTSLAERPVPCLRDC